MQDDAGELKPTIGSKDVPKIEWVGGQSAESVSASKPSETAPDKSAQRQLSREAMLEAADQRMRDHTAMRAAELRAKPLRKVEKVAAGDAWFTAIGAGFTVLTGIFQLEFLIVGGLLVWVSVNSFRGLARIKRRDPTAFKMLALNQLLLAGIIIAYCLYSMHGAGKGLAAVDPDLMKELGPDANNPIMQEYSGMATNIIMIVYEAIAVGSIIMQGLMALYYLSKRHIMEEYLEETPDWILKLGH